MTFIEAVRVNGIGVFGVGLLGLACSAGGALPGPSGSSGAQGGAGSNVGGGGAASGGSGITLGGSLGVGGGVDGPFPIPDCTMACLDFPAEPILDEASSPPVTPAEVGAFTADPGFAEAAYCVREPQLSSGAAPGALLPANWLRPRFRWEAPSGEELFELRLHHELEVNDLVVYTRNRQWLLPPEIWEKVGRNLHTPITVTIRGIGGGASGVTGVTGTFQVAPVNAGGSMVFWATSSKAVSKTASRLLGFTVGDEGVASTLTLEQVETDGILDEYGQVLRLHPDKPDFQAGEVQCIGCHVATPDGQAVVFGDDWPWDKVSASIEAGTEGRIPEYLTTGARTLLNMPWQGAAAMTAAHWTTGDRIVVTSFAERSDAFPGSRAEGEGLIWIDLETPAPLSNAVSSTDPYAAMVERNAAIAAAKGTAWGELALDGEAGAAVMPDLSADGARVVYTSTSHPQNGHLSKSRTDVFADIHVAPYGDRSGGAVTPVEGAADPAVWEYYPSFSSDDAFLAFNRVASTTAPPYYNGDGEIFVVPSSGGAAHRLAANDPPACTGEVSPGVTNSWAKWSPSVHEVDGKKYYFLVFGSTRQYDEQFTLTDPYDGGGTVKSSQLYMAAFVLETATGAITSYPAVYLWNQGNLVIDDVITPSATTNLTPAWDEFVIPPVTVVVK